MNLLYTLIHDLHGAFPAECGQLLLQQTHARLPCIPGNQRLNPTVIDFQLCPAQTMTLELPGKQMAFGNLQFFLIRIAGQLNDLHTVQQGFGNGIGGIGGGNEHHIG